MTIRHLLVIACLWTALAVRSVAAADTNVGAALDSVAWIGPGVSLADLRDKTVVVLTYVTWCPKCNVWSPDLFAQIKDAAAEQPVVVVAVCTDAPSVPGPKYVSEKGLVGRNIVHAYDARMDAKLGLDDAALFNATVIGPDGNIVWQGAAGAHYPQDDGSKKYVVAEQVRKSAEQGSFTIVSPQMPDAVQSVLWPMEMGRIVADRDLARAKRALSAEGRAALENAVNTFVERQWTLIDELSAGEIPQQMAAYEKADLLAKAYGSSDQGRQARALVGQLNRDSGFKREIAARKAYEQILTRTANLPAAKRQTMLSGFAKRFAGTYFAEQAEAMVARDEVERTSTGAEPVVAP